MKGTVSEMNIKKETIVAEENISPNQNENEGLFLNCAIFLLR